MTKPDTGARRLERLERVLAGRRARLAATLERQQRRVAASGPLDDLQRHGYSLALLLALAAVFPTLVGFAFKRHRLIARTATSGLGIRKLRGHLDSARSAGSGR